FSSSRRHTRFSRDWSSDVCSSDLSVAHLLGIGRLGHDVSDGPAHSGQSALLILHLLTDQPLAHLGLGGQPLRGEGTDVLARLLRSEERRVGTELYTLRVG